MTQLDRNAWRLAAVEAIGIAAVMLFLCGCRGNLGSALAVATGRVQLDSLQTTTAQQAALANRSNVMTPEGAYPSLADGGAPINQASFEGAGHGAGLGTTAGLFPAVDPVTGNPAAAPSSDEAYAAILPEIQRLAEVNPAAGRRLLAEMRTADPAHWPLLVRRVRADLAVHEQLNQSAGQAPPARPASHAGGDHHHGAAGGSATRPPAGSETRSAAGSGTRSASGSGSRPADLFRDREAAFDQQATAPRPSPGFSVRQTAYNDPPSELHAAFDPPPIRGGNQGSGTRSPNADPQASGSSSRRLFEDRAADHQSFGAAAGSKKPMAKLMDGGPAAGDRFGPGPRVIDNPMVSPSLGGLTWQDALQQAIAGLGETAPSPPHSPDEAYQHARLRLMQLAAGDLDGAATAIPGLSSTEQAYWSHQLFALSKLMDSQTHPETKRRAAAANLHLAKAAAELDSLSRLTVRGMTFCDKVYGFGTYDVIDDPTFRPGAELTLYAEVRHYKSVRVGGGLHTATLAISSRLLNSRGDVVQSDDVQLIEDECYSKRRDFHIALTYPLPEEITPGEYRLELTIEDRLGKKRDTSSIDLWVE